MNTFDPAASRRCFRFGPFVADMRKRLLWCDGALVGLTPKAFEILAVLLEHAGEVVEKEDLLGRVWGDTAVEDATLARHISTLRRALQERPTEHRYIVTVPGHGYEFVAEVVVSENVPENLRHTIEPRNTVEVHAPVDPAPAVAMPEPVPARASWLALAVSGGLATAVAAAVVLVVVFRPSPHREAPTLRQLTYHGGYQREPQWSPDGTAIAYTSEQSGNSDIWIQRTTEPEPHKLTTSPSEDSQPSWSPDGQSIVFRSERDGGGLFAVDVNDGREWRVSPFGYRPRWSPDGSQVLFSSSNREGTAARYYLVSPAGGTPRPLRPDVLNDIGASYIAWRPDGGAVSLLSRARGALTFMTVPIIAGPAIVSSRPVGMDREIAKTGLSLERFVWARSSRALYFEGTSQRVRNLWRIEVDPATLAWSGGPDRLTTGAGQDGEVAVSPEGTRLVFSTRLSTTRVWAFPFDPLTGRVLGDGKPVTSGGGEEQDADAPLDGSKLVYSATRAGRQELWERSIVDGREHLLLSTATWSLTRPRWSPDGLQLAYTRRRPGLPMDRAEPAVALLAIGGEERLLTKPGDVNLVPSDWSRDGRQLLGMCGIGTPSRIAACILPVSEGPQAATELRIVASDPAKNLFEERFSPDQRWITFMAVDVTDTGVSRVFVVPAAGGEWRPVTEGRWYDDKPHWSPDGKTLYFTSDRYGALNVWGRRFDTATGTAIGEPFAVTSFTTPRQTLSMNASRTQIAVTRTQLFVPITETAGEIWTLEGVDR